MTEFERMNKMNTHDLESLLKFEFKLMDDIQSELRGPDHAGKENAEKSRLEDKYYAALKRSHLIRKEITSKINNSVVKSNSTVDESIEEKRAIKEANITCSTYERSQRILNRNIDNWSKGKRVWIMNFEEWMKLMGAPIGDKQTETEE